MSTLAQISALVGLVLPLLIAVVQQSHWSRLVRTVVGVACSLVASVITPAIYSHLTLHTWGTSVVLILGAALTTYRNVWLPLGAAPLIESKTNIQAKVTPTPKV